MKKKLCLIAAVLLLLLLAGCNTAPAEAGEPESPLLRPPPTSAPADAADSLQDDVPTYYAAYAKIVQEYRQQYGPERIYFSTDSYRWAAEMDWDTDSQQVLTKALDTINLLRSST